MPPTSWHILENATKPYGLTPISGKYVSRLRWRAIFCPPAGGAKEGQNPKIWAWIPLHLQKSAPCLSREHFFTNDGRSRQKRGEGEKPTTLKSQGTQGGRKERGWGNNQHIHGCFCQSILRARSGRKPAGAARQAKNDFFT